MLYKQHFCYIFVFCLAYCFDKYTVIIELFAYAHRHDNILIHDTMKNNFQDPAFRELLEHHFTLLKPYRNRSDVFTAEVRVRGYSDIAYCIADLLKVSILAMDSNNGASVSTAISEPNINILGVLELALALLPYEEFELLDVLHRGLLDATEAAVPVDEPLYNYSVVRVLGG